MGSKVTWVLPRASNSPTAQIVGSGQNICGNPDPEPHNTLAVTPIQSRVAERRILSCRPHVAARLAQGLHAIHTRFCCAGQFCHTPCDLFCFALFLFGPTQLFKGFYTCQHTAHHQRHTATGVNCVATLELHPCNCNHALQM